MRRYNCRRYIKCLETLKHFDSDTCDHCDRPEGEEARFMEEKRASETERVRPPELPSGVPKKKRGWPKGKPRSWVPRKEQKPPEEPEPPNPDPGRPEPGPPIPIKTCKQCKQPFPATEEYFHKHARGKYGVEGKCKACRNKLHRDLDQGRKEDAEKYHEEQSKPLFTKASTEELVDALQKSAGMAIAREVVTQLRNHAKALNGYADNLEERYLK